MLKEIFSDHFANENNFLSRIDARIKIICVFGAIAATLFSRTLHVPLIITLLVLTLLVCIKMPLRIVLIRVLCPLGMTAVILIMQVLFYGQEGVSRGLLIVGKVIGCVSLITFLSLTTSLAALLRAASWLGVSKTWIEIAAISYRYVFVLIEDAVTIRDAQKVRLGYSNLSRSLKSLAELAGVVFIRAYDQSIATYEAMRSRGAKSILETKDARN